MRALLLTVVTLSACSPQIGDSCSVSTDCAQDGSRVCDQLEPGGYCTIEGCDFGTCPGDSECVRFFPGLSQSVPCAAQSDCADDEICTLEGVCAPRSIEVRFCMKKCNSGGDCRSGYECRTEALMKIHGGEPVPDPSTPTTIPTQAFCGAERSCTVSAQCDDGYVCSLDSKTCVPM
jgi:hypothetical protein